MMPPTVPEVSSLMLEWGKEKKPGRLEKLEIKDHPSHQEKIGYEWVSPVWWKILSSNGPSIVENLVSQKLKSKGCCQSHLAKWQLTGTALSCGPDLFHCDSKQIKSDYQIFGGRLRMSELLSRTSQSSWSYRKCVLCAEAVSPKWTLASLAIATVWLITWV